MAGDVEAVIFVGIQASGKSTFYLQRFFHTHVRINLDMLRTRRRERLLLQACLDMRQPFVVDNTNFSVEQRAEYIAAAREAGCRVVGYFFDTTPLAAAERNEAREGRARVPRPGIFGTHKRLQPPTYAEGFDALYVVHPIDGRFDVAEIPPDA